MKADENHDGDVDERKRNDRKAVDQIFVSVKRDEIGMNSAGCQVQQMKYDERRDNRTAQHHRSRCPTGMNWLIFLVTDGPCLSFDRGQRHGSPNMQEKGTEKNRTDRPQQRRVAVERFSVMIHDRG